MRVEEVDARTAPDETLRVFHAIERACLLLGDPGRDETEAVSFYRHAPSTHTRVHWLVEDAGAASLYVHSPTAVFLHLLVVPGRRRRGIGTALLDAALARARDIGVQTIYGYHAEAGGASFARNAGAVDGQRLVESVVDLRTAALPDPTPPDGWQLVTWIGRVPDEHIDAYAIARTAMDDAPQPEGMGLPAESAERVRAMEASLAARNRELRVTVAIREGEIGAFTDLRTSPGAPAGFTDDTGTVARHRGRGLATAVKLESLRAFREDHPDVPLVTTSNDEENEAMLRINRRIGFTPYVVRTQAELAL